MIPREHALAATPRGAIGLALVLIPWAAAIAWNAFERRGEIAAWLKSTT